ncbi:SDR family oxidoreductase [Streptomyces sp. SD15]
MTIAVMGGTGRVGSQVVEILRAAGHEAAGHSLSTGVDAGHAVVLSIVGIDPVPDSAYHRAKVLQEDILKAGPLPYSIVRATRFFERTDMVMSATADENTVRLPATPKPLQGTREITGPGVCPLDEPGGITLTARGDHRTVTTAGLLAIASGDTLIAGEGAVIAPTAYRQWLALQAWPEA